VPLPPRFRYPDDARRQLVLAREYMARQFGAAPAGLWPSEGSVSDEVFAMASELGFEWAATDSGVLNRTLGRVVPVDGLYRPYCWRQGGKTLNAIFRDHFLSDLIGFVYAKMDAAQAAEDFLRRIRENCAGLAAAGRDALVPIILDGENAWEYYDHNGRPFLRELYRRITEDRRMSAVTVSEALRLLAPEPVDHIFPGSWIDANFDVWIGAEEDNQAWTHLLRARRAYDSAAGVAEDQRRLALEELLIAEGSDWCWWYGPEHHSANRVEFDQLYRSHLANVYRFLNLTPPEELSRPILRVELPEVRVAPSGPVTPVIDGEVTSYFEWIGAGIYRVDERTGSMHGKTFLVKEVYFGSDGASFYLRVDFHAGCERELARMEARVTAQTLDGAHSSSVEIGFANGAARATGMKLAAPPPEGQPVECAFARVLEARISLKSMGVAPGGGLRFQFSLWQSGLPMDAVPQQGWLEMRTTDPLEMAG
jgi:alpha-amylase/alpha-mannosidase (GH57 family)